MRSFMHIGKRGDKWHLYAIPVVYIGSGLIWLLLVGECLPRVFGTQQSFLMKMTIDVPFLLGTGWLLHRVLQKDRAKRVQLWENEVWLHKLIHAVPDLIFVNDREGRIVEANEVALQIFLQREDVKREEADLSLISQSEIFQKSFGACAITDEQLWRSGNPVHFEVSLPHPKDGIRHFHVLKIPLYHQGGQRKGICIIGRDLTDRKRAEDALLAAKVQLESFMTHLPDAISLSDREEKVIYSNPASGRIFGWTEEEVKGKRIPSIPDHLQEEAHELHQRVLAGSQVVGYETIRKRKDGTDIVISLTVFPLRDETGEVAYIAGIARDITEQKQVEKLLRESEAKYRLIAENMSDLIQIMDLEGNTLYASPSHKMVLGYEPEMFLGRFGLEFCHPDEIDEVIHNYRRLIETKEPGTMEFRFKHRNGHWVILEARGMPVLDQDGQVEQVVLVLRDVTERKQTEELLRQSDKLSALGQLAAGIAHEIRNPLTTLRGFIQLLKKAGGDRDRYCEIMLDELDRINFIVSELLLLAKPQVVSYRFKELPDILHDVISLLGTQAILHNIRIVSRLEENLPPLYCEENQIKQVFINILRNAIEAMPKGGEIHIEAEASADGWLIIRFHDQGCGIEPERIAKLGVPFYTTKERGTGLGLMVGFKIIEDHGGKIRIESTPFVGTTVEVRLPTRNPEQP
ncbi:PAS domain S-box protein [Brevibacillus sp. SYP-B805]|uniref:PAS domain S-box protein n=1 Tax=Brevibacillus sp. SYP-B805 TaxID=1578199 RepID=UPI0013EB9A4D|nr:PAS domain S-box protein [Brevibacillus sp. SYP-B805]NGQ94738.1 PAS domain S-box protein [Brevibacillus sp. SYP-B805]